METRYRSNANPIISLIVLVAILAGLYFVTKSLFVLLAWVAPVLLIITLFLDHKVILNFGKGIVTSFQTNWPMGLLKVAACFFAFPLVSAYLFSKALLNRKVEKIKEEIDIRENGELVDYEELEDDDFLELKVPQTTKKPQNSEYEDLFE